MLINNLKPIMGKTFCFSIDSNKNIQYRPYFELQDEAITCYPAVSYK